MKLITIKHFCVLLVTATLVVSCDRDFTNVDDLGNYTDTSPVLKESADFPIGTAVSHDPMLSDNNYAAIAKRDFDIVTFEYHMKHGAIVKDDGTLDFAKTDALVDACSGMEIFGHTLAWHSNQNASYLKNYAGIVVPAATNLLANGTFENGGAANFNNWSTYNSGNPAGTSTITVGAGASEVRTGSRSMKVINPVGYPGSQWRVQVASDLFPTINGKQYVISYWIKAAAAGGSIRLSTGPNAQYQGDQTIGTGWQEVTWTITANSAETRILFDMGQAANTYYIDDASVKEVVPTPSGGEIAGKLATALEYFISNTVDRYKSKVKSWDVLNEMFADDGNVRTNSNTATTNSDVLVWSNYMGKDFGFKAFEYAAAADPAADLYINDYALESRPAKLDSLLKFVDELKGRNLKVDGIGTQMHIDMRNPNYAGIDRAFEKLAATGLKIRVSELDVKMNSNNAVGFTPTQQLMSYQADLYRFVVQSYLRHVPAAQRAGITIWGVTDQYSWLYNNGKEFPLLYDKDYNKKPAYAGVLQGLN